MGIKNVFKWRVTSTKYLYLTDEENKNPFILDKKTGDRTYPLPASGSTVTGITFVTGMTLDEGLISQTAAQIKNETDYSRKYNRMVELAYKDDDASGLTFLDYTKYFNLDGDECIEEAVAPKCEGYDPVFDFRVHTIDEHGDKEIVPYEFYSEKNEQDKTLRYVLDFEVPKGEKGEKGNDGAGCKGEPGDPGLPAIFDDITASIEAKDPDAQPTIDVYSSSTTANTYQLEFEFGIPRGEKGDPGVQGDPGDPGVSARLTGVDIETETLSPGEEAYVQIKDGTYETNLVYDSSERKNFYDTTFTLQFGLPQGIQGIQGDPGLNAEIRNVTVSEVRTIDAGHWEPNDYDPNREWIPNNASAGVTVTPTGGGNVVDLDFWFEIPRGEKGDKGDSGGGGGGGGALYDFDNVVVHQTNEPDPYFILHEEPTVISGKLGTKVWLEFYYPSSWSGGGGGGDCDIKHRYDYLETGSDSLSEGVEKVVGGVSYPFAIASGSRSHAEGIGYTSSAVLEFLVAGLKNDCHGDNIVVMPKEQFIGYVWDSDIINEDFFKGATFNMPSGVPINANRLPAGVTESQFRNSTLKITSCELYSEDAEDSYYSLGDVGIEFTVGGQTYQISGSQFESYLSGIGANAYVDWRYPITLHLANRSHVEEPNAIGIATHTEGRANFAVGDYSHAEGSNTRTDGVAAHAEGANTKAYGSYSHAEGFGTTAYSQGGFAGGYASNDGEIKCGWDNEDGYFGVFVHGYADHEGLILGEQNGSHAEGYATYGATIKTTEEGAFAYGRVYGTGTTIGALEDGSMAGGCASGGAKIITNADGAHAEGYAVNIGSEILSDGDGSYAGGYVNGGKIIASADGSFSRGFVNSSASTIEATSDGSYAGGYANGGKIIASANGSFSRGFVNNSASTIEATSGGSVAFGYAKEGGKIISSGNGSFAHGITDSKDLKASGSGSHAEGHHTQALGQYTHAEGEDTVASGNTSHAEGSKTTTNAAESHAEGANTEANGRASHVEGSECITTSNAKYAHAEGVKNEAQAEGAHAEGNKTVASGKYSHAGGIGTVANQQGLTVFGKFNKTGTTTDDMFIVGGGTSNSDSNRKNALVVKNSGQLVVPYSTGGLKFESGGSANLVWNSTGGTTDVSGIGGGGRAIQVNGSQILSSDSTTALNISAGTGISISGTTGGIVTIASTVVNTDTKVTQTSTNSGDVYYSVLFSESNFGSYGNTTLTEGARKANTIAYNPGKGLLKTNNIWLKNNTNYGTAIYFGDNNTVDGTSDDNYAYIKEDVDDHLEIYGDRGITIESGSDYGDSKITLSSTAYGIQVYGSITAHDNHDFVHANNEFNFAKNYSATSENIYLNYQGPVSGRYIYDWYFCNGHDSASGGSDPTRGTKLHAGAYYASSDERRKDVVEQISLEKAYELVEKCQTIYFTWKDDEKKKVEIGLLAQEVQKYFPEIVSENNEGYLSLDYSKLTVILMTVIKDLTERVKNLETLEERIKRLEEKLG